MIELTTAKRAARDAGRLLLGHMGRLTDVRYKSERDPVSEADKASEALIASIIKSTFPAHGFVGEEETTWSPGVTDGPRWIVDPLDGTVNFAHAYPAFCVSIALERYGHIALGVVYDPIRREMFHAVRGGGAFLNNRPIHVSTTDSMIRSLLATGFPYHIREVSESVLSIFGRMALSAQGIRRNGSAALDLCNVAAGRFDGFWEVNLKAWNTAAGMLMVQEAGGVVTDFSGNDYRPGMYETVAGNGIINAAIISIINES